jgi:hypothetical protein
MRLTLHRRKRPSVPDMPQSTPRGRLRTERRETRKRLRAERVASRDTGASQHVPAWVDWLPRGGWPVVAVIVMVMCAPGEHHLAVMAGWEQHLAWGMPACLVAYAGIAASVATRRERGAQGRFTAILGAFISLAAAMAAQPVSHLFVTGHWASDPSPVWLVVSVSCVPPLVLGHLMHVAASHSVRPTVPATVPVPVVQDVAQKTVPATPEPRPAETRPASPKRPTPVASGTPDETQTLLTVAEAAAVASQARGETVTPSTIRSWKHRGRLTPALDGDTLFERDAVTAAATRNGKGETA